MRKLSIMLLSLSILFILGACGSGENAESNGNNNQNNDESASENGDEPIKIKVAHIAGPDEPFSIGFEEYAEAVEEATDNQVEFEIFGNGEMGGEADVVEQVQLGSVDMTLVTTGVLGDFSEDLKVLDLPFLFKDVDHAYTVLDSDLGQELLDTLDDQGLKGISFWENGVRHVSNNEHPIEKPEDMEKLKIRTVENDLFIDTYKALGADPVPMAFPEVYSSLQQGVIDGNDQPYTILSGKKIVEVQEYLSELELYYASGTLLMSDEFYESMPEDIQETIVDLGKEYAEEERQIAQDLDEELKEEMKDDIEIIDKEDLDLDAFIEKVQPVYDNLDDTLKDYVEQIEDME